MKEDSVENWINRDSDFSDEFNIDGALTPKWNYTPTGEMYTYYYKPNEITSVVWCEEWFVESQVWGDETNPRGI